MSTSMLLSVSQSASPSVSNAAGPSSSQLIAPSSTEQTSPNVSSSVSPGDGTNVVQTSDDTKKDRDTIITLLGVAIGLMCLGFVMLMIAACCVMKRLNH
ncbi:hypothetical protein ABFA07_012340 [Porites harrisoni]